MISLQHNSITKSLTHPFLISRTVSAKWAAPPSGKSVKDNKQKINESETILVLFYHSA